MSNYSDSDYERAMNAIVALADDDKNDYKDLSLVDAKERLKQILDIAEGGEVPYGFFEGEDNDNEDKTNS